MRLGCPAPSRRKATNELQQRVAGNERERALAQTKASEGRKARLDFVAPQEVDDRASEFSVALEQAGDDPGLRDEVLAQVDNYATVLSSTLDEPFEKSLARLNRRMKGSLASRKQEQRDELRARQIALGSPEAVEASVGQAAQILEQMQSINELSPSQITELGASLGSLRTRSVSAIVETRDISVEAAEKVYDDRLNAASAGRFNERKKEERAQNRLSRQVSAVQKNIDGIEQQLEDLGESEKDTPQYRDLQKRLTNQHAVQAKLLNEHLSSDNPVLARSQFIQQDLGLYQTVTGIGADLQAMERLALQDPGFLGATRGGLTASLIEAVNKGTDIGQVFLSLNGSLGQGLKTSLLSDTDMPEKVKQRLIGELGFEDSGFSFLGKRTDAKILVSRMAYAYTRMLNPGRFSDAQYKNNLKLFDFTIGSAQNAMTKLRSGITEMRKAEMQLADRVQSYNPQTTRDAEGNIRDAATYEILIRAPEAQPVEQGTGSSTTADMDAVDAALREMDQ